MRVVVDGDDQASVGLVERACVGCGRSRLKQRRALPEVVQLPFGARAAALDFLQGVGQRQGPALTASQAIGQKQLAADDAARQRLVIGGEAEFEFGFTPRILVVHFALPRQLAVVLARQGRRAPLVGGEGGFHFADGLFQDERGFLKLIEDRVQVGPKQPTQSI